MEKLKGIISTYKDYPKKGIVFRDVLTISQHPLLFNKLVVNMASSQIIKNADAIILLTDWDEFKSLDWSTIFNMMRKPAWIFDSRICLEKEFLRNIGFKLWTLGNKLD